MSDKKYQKDLIDRIGNESTSLAIEVKREFEALSLESEVKELKGMIEATIYPIEENEILRSVDSLETAYDLFKLKNQSK